MLKINMLLLCPKQESEQRRQIKAWILPGHWSDKKNKKEMPFPYLSNGNCFNFNQNPKGKFLYCICGTCRWIFRIKAAVNFIHFFKIIHT
jgi:hypothetical protein